MSESEEITPDELMRRSKKLSIFALAHHSASISAEIEVKDVKELRPDWTTEQAVEFLREHRELIGPEMLLRGLTILTGLLERSKYDN